MTIGGRARRNGSIICRANGRVEMWQRQHPVDAVATLPGSKSLTLRALVAAALSGGTSTISGALDSDDTRAMRQALVLLGASIEVDPGTKALRVKGTGGSLPSGPLNVNAEDAGTVARFLTPILSLGHGDYIIDGSPRVRLLPMEPLLALLRELGVEVGGSGLEDRLPLLIRASGNRGGCLNVHGKLGSQFITGLLLAAPMMDHGLSLTFDPPIVKPFVRLTIEIMAKFGVDVSSQGGSRFDVPFRDSYASADLKIEPDAVAASYLIAAAAVTHGRIEIAGLGSSSSQAEVNFARVLRTMGASVEINTNSIVVDCVDDLNGFDVDLRRIPDVFPAAAVAAAAARTPSRIRGLASLRSKERDRISALANGLRSVGTDVQESQDGMLIVPRPLQSGTIDADGDQRIAMAFGVLGLAAPRLVLLGAGCVNKSYPGFFEDLRAL